LHVAAGGVVSISLLLGVPIGLMAGFVGAWPTA